MPLIGVGKGQSVMHGVDIWRITRPRIAEDGAGWHTWARIIEAP